MAHSHVGIGDIVTLNHGADEGRFEGVVTDRSVSDRSVVFRVKWNTGRSWVYEPSELTVITEVSPVHFMK